MESSEVNRKFDVNIDLIIVMVAGHGDKGQLYEYLIIFVIIVCSQPCRDLDLGQWISK